MKIKYVICVDEDRVDKSDRLLLTVHTNNAKFDMPIGIQAEPFEQQSAYQKGLEDAWDAARKICLDPRDNGIPFMDMKEVLGCVSVYNAMASLTAAEAIKKIRDYETKGTPKIQVGDEVIIAGTTGIVTRINEHGRECYIDKDGRTYANNADAKVTKTGRHFSEVPELLKKIGSDQDGAD